MEITDATSLFCVDDLMCNRATAECTWGMEVRWNDIIYTSMLQALLYSFVPVQFVCNARWLLYTLYSQLCLYCTVTYYVNSIHCVFFTFF